MSVLTSSLSALLVLVLWRHLSPGGILFYQGVAVAALAGVLGGALAVAFARRRRATRGPGGARPIVTTPFKDGLLAALLVYAFVFTVPTTVDRSYSVRLLQRLAQADAGMTESQVTTAFLADFAVAGGVHRRLDEQLASGNIVRDGDTWRLTARGRALTDAFRTTCQVFVCAP